MKIPLIKYWLSTSWLGTRWVEVVVGESGGVSKSVNQMLMFRNTLNVLKFFATKFLTVWHMQTVQTQIRLLLRAV